LPEPHVYNGRNVIIEILGLLEVRWSGFGSPEETMEENIKVDKTLDIKGQVCPYTFVRSKLTIEKMNLGEVLEIILDHKPAVENVPKSMENEGQKVLKIAQTGEKEWHIFVRKDKDRKKNT
jgi:TusA-related sulfurtransferase